MRAHISGAMAEVRAWLEENLSSRPARVCMVLLVLLMWARQPLATGILLGSVVVGLAAGWVRRRRELAELTGTDQETARQLLSAWWLELRRRGELVRWGNACRINGLVMKPAKKPARLFRVRGTLAGDLTACFAGGRVGVYPEEVQANATQIAQTIGCKEVVVRKTAPGCAELTFLWSEPLERTLPVAETVLGPKGTVTYGTRRDGSPAFLQLGLSALISGMTGAGKSGLCWSLFANMNRVGYRYGLKYDLWISDAKGGTELTPFADKLGVRNGPVLVRGYAKDVPQTAKLIDEFYRELKARQDLQPFRKWTVNHSAEYPLLVLLIDEMYELAMMLPKASKDKLAVVLSQIRAAGGMVIMCTQQAQKEVIGAMRDLYPQRLSLAQPDATATTMVLGNSAEQLGAKCSQIPTSQPGLGYSFEVTARGFEPFRAGWCTDRDIERIAAGKLPKGMPVRSDQWCVYQFFNAAGELLYVGFTNDFKRRRREHAREKEWWPLVDVTRTVVKKYRSEVEARAVESAAIKAEAPVFNVSQNRVRGWARRIPVPSVPQLPQRRRLERVEVGPPPGAEWWRDPAQPIPTPNFGHYEWQGAE